VSPLPPPQVDLDAAYAHCRAVVEARAKNFSYAFLLLPPAKRRALEAIYGYCRVADDYADDDGLEPEVRAANLADLRARLALAIPEPGDPPATALEPRRELDLMMAALGDAALRFGVRRGDLDLVAEGCVQDLSKTRYATFEELHRYCYMVASAVGLACLSVFGHREDPAFVRPMAVDLGIAMQLTNILRDVAEDMDRDRIYLPLEDLERFGVDEAQLRSGRVDANWKALAAFQARRARAYFARGKRLAAWVQRDARVCPPALAAIYERLLDAIEAADFDVFSARVSLSSRSKLGLMGLSALRGLSGL
jgi:phytoene synthase